MTRRWWLVVLAIGVPLVVLAAVSLWWFGTRFAENDALGVTYRHVVIR